MMKTNLRVGLCLGCVAPLLGLAWGQPVIKISDLASEPGDTYRMVSNNGPVSVSEWVGRRGGPQHWDFRDGAEGAEHEYLVHALEDTSFGRDFRQAAYAIEQKRLTEGSQAWTFYRNLSGVGRQYFGFFDNGVSIASQQVVFDAPTVDLVMPLQFGDEWTREVEFPSDLAGGGLDFPVAIKVLFDSIATVDAYGTMSLPGIGEVEVVRVNESNRYETVADLFGMPTALDTQYFQSYSWYAPKIGLVAQILSGAETRPPADPLGTAAHFFRLVSSSRVSSIDPPPSADVAGVKVGVVGGLTTLRWEPVGGSDSYDVMARDSLVSGSWEKLANVSGTIYVDPSDGLSQRFYRILVNED